MTEIEKMVNIMGNATSTNLCHKDCPIETHFDDECALCRAATALYNAGYRKVVNLPCAVCKGLDVVQPAFINHRGVDMSFCPNCGRDMSEPINGLSGEKNIEL